MDKYLKLAERIEKALCNHRESEGRPDYLQEMPDGRVYCTKCGRSFKPVNMSDSISDKIEAACNDVIDVIESIKLADPNLDREYKLLIPLLEELPDKFTSVINQKK